MPLATGLALGLGAGLGGAKYIEDKNAKDTAVNNNKAIIRYSPWTHLTPGEVPKASLIGDVMQGGLSGGMLNAQNPAAAGAAGGGATAAEAGGAPSLGVASQSLPSAGAANQNEYSNIVSGNSPFANPGSAGALGGAGMPMAPGQLQNPWGQMRPQGPQFNYGMNS